MRIKLITLLLLFLWAIVATNTVSANDTLIETNERYYYFNSEINIRTYASPDIDLTPVHEAIDELLLRVHCVSTRYDDPAIDCDGFTQVKDLNNNPGTETIVDEIVVDMIDMSVNYYNDPRTGGKFNIALGKVIDVWAMYTDMCQIEGNCVVPELEELEAAATNIDLNTISYDLDANTVMVPEGMELDLGAIAKGYGAKMVGELLRDEFDDILDAWMIDAGTSNIEFYGNHPSDERDYWIGTLRDPFSPTQGYANVTIYSGQNLVTSGDYDRYYTVDGVNYHHLIDPDTLFPSNHIRGVTIISNDPALGDIYSTIAFILPLEDAIAFIDDVDDVEGIWVDEDGYVHMSEGFEDTHMRNYIEPRERFDQAVDTGQSTVVIILFSILGVITVAFIIVVLTERKKTEASPSESE